MAIPAYDRPDALDCALLRFICQVALKYEGEVEIVVTDDNAPEVCLRGVQGRTSIYLLPACLFAQLRSRITLTDFRVLWRLPRGLVARIAMAGPTWPDDSDDCPSRPAP